MPLARGSAEPLLYAAIAAAITAGAVWLAHDVAPALPVVLLGGGAVAALALANPIATVLLAIALIPLEIVSFEAGDVAGFSPAEIVFVLAALGWVARTLVAGRMPFADSPLTKPLAILLLVAVAGLGVAGDEVVTLKIVLMWTAFFFIFQMIVAEGTPATVGRILVVLAAAGGVLALITIATPGQEQSLGALGTEATGRAEGSFGHPNLLAVFLATTLTAAVAVAIAGRPALRPVGVAAFAAALMGLALTLSRGGLLAAGAAIAVMLLLRPFRRAAGAAAAICVVAVLVSGGSALGDIQTFDRVTKRIESVRYAAQGADPRSDLWRRTPEIIRDHPVIGIGAGQFPVVASRYGLRDPASNDHPFSHAHNIPLTVAAELGLVGLAALLWLAVALAVAVVRACRRTRGRERAYAFAIGAALVAIATQGVVDYTVRSNVVAALSLTLAAAAVVLAQSSPSPAMSAPNVRRRILRSSESDQLEM